jgi:hypothetical protein
VTGAEPSVSSSLTLYKMSMTSFRVMLGSTGVQVAKLPNTPNIVNLLIVVLAFKQFVIKSSTT